MVAFWKAQNGSDDDFEVISTAGYDDISAVEPGDDKFSYSVTFKQRTAEWPQYVYPRLPANVSSSPKLFNDGLPHPGDHARTARSSSLRSTPTKGVITQEPNPRWWGAGAQARRRSPGTSPIPRCRPRRTSTTSSTPSTSRTSTYAIARDTGTVQRAAGVDWSQVTLNGGRGPLADVDVRRAVAHAINRETIATTHRAGPGRAAGTAGQRPAGPGPAGLHRLRRRRSRTTRRRAKQLLAEAGYVAGADGMLAKDGQAAGADDAGAAGHSRQCRPRRGHRQGPARPSASR